MSAGTGAIPARNASGISRLLNLTLGDIRGEGGAIALLIPLLLAAVFWNGFPLIYYDTGAYVLEGLGGHFMAERSPVYSLFLRVAGAGTSLWFIVLIQAAATAYVVTQCARAEIPRLKPAALLLMVAFLVIATGFPWYVGQIEPDCFTALVVLAIYLLAFRANILGRPRAIVLAGIGGFAAAAHPSHLVLTGILVIVIVAARAVVEIAHRWPKPRLLEPTIVGILGLALIVGANFLFTQEIFISRAGASFVFARMLQDGIVMRLLDDTCPKSGYTLCAYRNSLPPTADGWLWTPDSPFFKLGHFEGTAAESARIVRDATLRYPSLQLEYSARDAAIQFIRFRTGDQIEPQEWVLYPVLAHYLPDQMRAYLAARQQRGEIDFRVMASLHVIVGALSLIGLVLFLEFAILRRRDERIVLPGFVLAALVGNAIICGVLSGPHDRYQSRLIWLAPFALMISLRSSWRPNDHLA
ncbi:MAG TPA: hypothetical protein VNX86_01675 [Rhizomicrobium sp.]|nr:hypothetical protein [Rhizomicrobium sp.]